MATQLFFRNAAADVMSGWSNRLDGAGSTWTAKNLTTTRGAAATSNASGTLAGPTAGIEVSSGAVGKIEWLTAPLDADITISGSITWNLRAAESAMAANVAINGILEKIDGATGAITLIDQTARVTELAVTTEGANNFAETPAAGIACKRGDRLRVRVFGDDAGTMGAGETFTFWWDGPTAAASGDSYLTLTENLTFVAEPAGTQIFPTDSASDVATASVDREAWTARGAGVQTDVTNTAAGPTVALQTTDTAAGTVVDWFTKPLTAFTLGGAVRCNIRAFEDGPGGTGAVADAGIVAEVAVVNNDGTGAVVWALGMAFPELTATTETAMSFLVAGDDLSVTAGQRLRIRLYIDDGGNGGIGGTDGQMAVGHTVTTYYAGAAGATGDTYLTFTQTLTESVTARVPYSTPYPQLLAH